MTSNKGMIHKDMDIHGILKNGMMKSIPGQQAEL